MKSNKAKALVAVVVGAAITVGTAGLAAGCGESNGKNDALLTFKSETKTTIEDKGYEVSIDLLKGGQLELTATCKGAPQGDNRPGGGPGGGGNSSGNQGSDSSYEFKSSVEFTKGADTFNVTVTKKTKAEKEGEQDVVEDIAFKATYVEGEWGNEYVSYLLDATTPGYAAVEEGAGKHEGATAIIQFFKEETKVELTIDKYSYKEGEKDQEKEYSLSATTIEGTWSETGDKITFGPKTAGPGGPGGDSGGAPQSVADKFAPTLNGPNDPTAGDQQQVEDNTDYSEFDFKQTGTWTEDEGYGYVLTIGNETIHVNYDKYRADHYFYFSVVKAADKVGSAVKYSAHDTGYMSKLAANYAIYEERTCVYHFRGSATTNNPDTTDLYLLPGGVAVDMTGRDSITYTKGTWTEDTSKHEITVVLGENTLKSEYSDKNGKAGYRISVASSSNQNKGNYSIFASADAGHTYKDFSDEDFKA